MEFVVLTHYCTAQTAQQHSLAQLAATATSQAIVAFVVLVHSQIAFPVQKQQFAANVLLTTS